MAIAHFTAENYEASLQEARIATRARPELPEGLIMLAAAASALGQIDEARHVVVQCVAQWPAIHLGNMMPIYIPSLARAADRERLSAALRQAGFPD